MEGLLAFVLAVFFLAWLIYMMASIHQIKHDVQEARNNAKLMLESSVKIGNDQNHLLWLISGKLGPSAAAGAPASPRAISPLPDPSNRER